MADVRPTQHPLVRVDAQRPALAGSRAAAQRAFFEAAMAGQTPAPMPAPEQLAKTPDLVVQMPKDQPQKILRPGSLLNILV